MQRYLEEMGLTNFSLYLLYLKYIPDSSITYACVGAFLAQVVKVAGQRRMLCIVVLAEYLKKLARVIELGWVWLG